ncbi:MAG: GNAT family N-acetyltransferase [Rhodobacteraceae bacterium]|nr:GNAT family N-acetyltransferase [Paracoccaceae bacterium]
MAVTVRPVEHTDRAAWQQLFAAYAAFYRLALAEDTAEAVWGWIHDPLNPFWADLAIAPDGLAVGLVQYQLMHRSLGGSMTCYLSDLYVAPEARGTGAGRAIIDHVCAFARGRGLPGVRWLTAEGNAAARKLYDSYAPRSEFVLYSITP